MKVLLAQVSAVVGDIKGNLAKCRDALAVAREHDCELVLFPEMVLSGYPPRDLLERRDLIAACDRATEALAADSGELVVVFGVPRMVDGHLRNVAVVAHDGRVQHVVCKTLLPTYDVFDEDRYFEPGNSCGAVEVAGMTLGVTICEDIWNTPEVFGGRTYDVDPVDALSACDVVVNLSASPFSTGKGRTRLQLVQRVARRTGAPVLYCNLVGGNDDLLFDGNSLAVAADGTLVAQGAAFEPDHLVVELGGPAVEHRELSYEEEVLAALVMGTRDYAHRCGFTKGLVGLSGGIDSAVVAVIAARALGPENVLCIGMPGPFSSEGSITDARELAENLGVRFDLMPIAEVHGAFLHTLAPFFAGRAPDVTEENLQARARGTLLMAISNKLGHLLLTTGNKSEMAVGYCTLYGDMNGGLAMLSDVFKTDVFRLARAMGPVMPQAIIDKPPSAELAPNQRDEDSLPPYAVLDAILRLYVEGLTDPADIVAQGHDPAIVQRVIRLVIRSEYKRWQAAPGLRVTNRAFGTGRRIPMAQGWLHSSDGLS